MCMYTNRRHMAICHQNLKTAAGFLLWLVEDHTRTGNNIQKDVHTFMKQSYHVPIIRVVQQVNEDMIW